MSHETAYRGENLLSSKQIVVCGAGTVGGNLTEFLAAIGCQLTVIDFDRVEGHNHENQPYGLPDYGSLKVVALQNRIYRDHQAEVRAFAEKLSNRVDAIRMLRWADVIIDAFDNYQSRELVRAYCEEFNKPCLHIGLFEGYGQAVWNEYYTTPNSASPAADTCEIPLAKSVAWLAVVVASELLYKWASGVKLNKQFSVESLTISDIF